MHAQTALTIVKYASVIHEILSQCSWHMLVAVVTGSVSLKELSSSVSVEHQHS